MTKPDDRFTKDLGIFWITLSGTVILLASTFLTWRSVVAIDRSIVAANRAWIAPQSMSLDGPIRASEPFDVTLHTKNVGRDPAVGLNWNIKTGWISGNPA